MATFEGWGSSWGAAWERISNPGAMYGSVTIRLTANGALDQPAGFISGAAGFSFAATGTLTSDATQTPQVSQGGAVRRGTAWLKQKRALPPEVSLANYNLTRLHQDDQVVTELLVSLVTKGFFDGNE